LTLLILRPTPVPTKVAAIVSKAMLVVAVNYAAVAWVIFFNAWAARKQYLAPWIGYYDALIAIAALSASAAVLSITERNARRVAGNLLAIFRGLIWGLSAAILLWPLAYFQEGIVLAGLFVFGTVGTLLAFFSVLRREWPAVPTNVENLSNGNSPFRAPDVVIE
jgi:hypothetical protein